MPIELPEHSLEAARPWLLHTTYGDRVQAIAQVVTMKVGYHKSANFKL